MLAKKIHLCNLINKILSNSMFLHAITKKYYPTEVEITFNIVDISSIKVDLLLFIIPRSLFYRGVFIKHILFDWPKNFVAFCCFIQDWYSIIFKLASLQNTKCLPPFVRVMRNTSHQRCPS